MLLGIFGIIEQKSGCPFPLLTQPKAGCGRINDTARG
nr:MAG TPA: hypothetical protein [Caudoviricetes sp.]